MSEPLNIPIFPEHNGLVVVQNGSAYSLLDRNFQLEHWQLSDVERAVLVTRLRAWADLIERAGKTNASR